MKKKTFAHIFVALFVVHDQLFGCGISVFYRIEHIAQVSAGFSRQKHSTVFFSQELKKSNTIRIMSVLALFQL